jgi:hypothetical protein
MHPDRPTDPAFPAPAAPAPTPPVFNGAGYGPPAADIDYTAQSAGYRAPGSVPGAHLGGHRGRPADHRPWSTVLYWFHLVSMACGVGLAALAVVLVVVVDSNTDSGSPWEGLGIVIGGLLFGIALVCLTFSTVMLVLTAKGRRRADEGRPGMLFGTAVAAAILAGLGVFLSLPQMAQLTQMGAGELVGLLVGLAVNGLYLTAAVLTAKACRIP